MEPIVRSKVTLDRTKTAEVANPPITTDVVLMCAGACKAFTPHRYVITRRAGMMTFEQIYGCTCCNAERRYGLLA